MDHLTGWFTGGGDGVAIFFVLSGFLITTLLVEETQRDGTIRLGRFYARRWLRLYPPLLLMLIVTAPFAHPTAAQLLGPTTYTTNLLDWFGHGTGYYGQTWSLALEEQFYLLWPLLLPFVLRLGARRGAAILFALAIGTHICGQLHFAFGLPTDNPLAVYNPVWQSGAIMMGCALSLATQGGRWRPPRPSLFVTAGTIICVTSAFLQSAISLFDGFLMGIVPELAAAGLIIGLIHTRHGLARAFTWGAVVWVGRRSYAIYLWHYPLIAYSDAHHWRGRIAALLVIGSVAAAEVSWRLVEAPIARYKRRQDAAARESPSPAPVIVAPETV